MVTHIRPRPPPCFVHQAPIFGKLDLKLRNQLQFKLDLEQNTFRNLTLASTVNQWKYVEDQRSILLSHFRPKVEREHSNTYAKKHPSHHVLEACMICRSMVVGARFVCRCMA
jgi:hypothetical protein